MLLKNKNVNGRTINAPQANGRWDTKNVCLILSGLSLLVTYICASTAYTPIFGGFLRIIGWLFFLISIALLMPVIRFVIKYKLINQPSLTELLHSSSFDQWLIGEGIFALDMSDSTKYHLPMVNGTNHLIKIQVIGGIVNKLKSDNTTQSLQAWLNNQGFRVYIKNKYVKDGWIFYILGDDLKRDQLRY
ncbi:hypothetical protein LMB33_00735 [Limosilactobacillus reuteri]|nr:hypothetical protein [Limosilactobacillus reuteri]MCC4325217.1 hypothetical protein [Limosilactobacillus reuteri]MCC4328936.1 hypothetical protein [Limosilactobacillus reuteri]